MKVRTTTAELRQCRWEFPQQGQKLNNVRKYDSVK